MITKVKTSPRKAGLYREGWKYCSRCMLFFKTDNIRCPYCGNLLRSGARRKTLKDIGDDKFIDPEKYGVKID